MRLALKILAVTLCAFIVLYGTLVARLLYQSSPEIAIVNAINGNYFYPRVLAKYYIFHSPHIAREIQSSRLPLVPFTLNDLYSFQTESEHEYVFDIVERELNLGADINAHLHGFTALYGAVLDNDPIKLRFLLDHGADRDARIVSGPLGSANADMTPLQLTLFLQEKFPHKDYSQIIRILEGKNKRE